MPDPFDYQSPDDSIANDKNIAFMLNGLMSPENAQNLMPASAQSIVAPPPSTAPKSGASQTTPLTGTLATAPSQSQPRVSGPAMIPGVAAKPEDLASGAAQTQVPLPSSGGRQPVIRDLNGLAPGHPLSTLNPGRSGLSGAFARQQQGSPASAVPAALSSIPGYSKASPQPTAAQPSQANSPAQSLQQRWSNILNRSPQQRQAALVNAAGPSASLPAMPATAMPDLGNPSAPTIIAPRGSLQGDQAELNRLQDSGSGVSQIARNVKGWMPNHTKLGSVLGDGLQILGTIGDVAGSALTPGIAAAIPGTTAHHQQLLARQEGIVGNDQQQQQQRAQLEDTQSQTTERNAQAAQAASRANYYNPVNLTPEQANSIGEPGLAGSPMDARDFARLQQAYGRDQTSLQTHTGGQSRKLSAADAAAIGMPSLAGATMSNDEYQRTLQQQQRNTQSGANNQLTNQTRVQTTNLKDQTSTANSERAHAGKGGKGAPKPIPPSVRDRIESQKNVAINKARSDFDSGASSQDDYLNAWQQAQDDFEQRISAQTGQPVPHTDIRSNVDAKGNWIGNRQGSTQRPPAQQQASPANHVFSPVAWQRANPKGNLSAATAKARRLGYQVVQ